MNNTLEKFTAQLTEEFLTCKICYEPFIQPKCLSCLHTFCKSCIESNLLLHSTISTYSRYREFSCPVCRKKTQIPLGGVARLQDNFIVSSLRDLVSADGTDRKEHKIQCSFCTQLKEECVPATMKCIECQKLLCEQCSDLHQRNQLSATHDLYELSIEQDITCPRHNQEIVRYFCDDCNQCVCIVCACGDTQDLHLNHNLINFKSAAKLRRPAIMKSLIKCKKKNELLAHNLNDILSIQEMIDTTKNSIVATASKFHKKIDDDRETTLASLDQFVSERTRNLLAEISNYKLYKDQLDNTCSLTELLLAGNDIEFLLMVEQLSEKLDVLYKQDTLITGDKKIRQFMFIEGLLNFGKVVYTNSNSAEINDGDADRNVKYKCAEVQSEHRERVAASTQTIFIPLMHDSNSDNLHQNEIDELINTKQNKVTKYIESNSDTITIGECKTMAQQTLDIREYELYRRHLKDKRPKSMDGKRVRRLVKKNCSVAALPNMDTIILDPENNCLSILDRKGKIRYFLSDNIFADPFATGINGFSSPSVSDSHTPRQVTVHTSQGLLTISFSELNDAKLPLAFTVHAYNSISANK